MIVELQRAHPRIAVEVPTLKEASAQCRRFIDETGLGASEWTGGRVFDVDGKPIARISYNGRIWGLDGKEIDAPPRVHTPGPWVASGKRRDGPRERIDVLAPPRTLPLATVPVDDYRPNAETDAQLIARAPRLLEALREVVARFALNDTAKDDEETRAFMAGVVELLEECGAAEFSEGDE